MEGWHVSAHLPSSAACLAPQKGRHDLYVT
jgi:hypothetical protein